MQHQSFGPASNKMYWFGAALWSERLSTKQARRNVRTDHTRIGTEIHVKKEEKKKSQCAQKHPKKKNNSINLE